MLVAPDDMKKRAIGYVEEKQDYAEKQESPPLTISNMPLSTLGQKDAGPTQTDPAPLMSSNAPTGTLKVKDTGPTQADPAKATTPAPTTKSSPNPNAENVPAMTLSIPTIDKRSDMTWESERLPTENEATYVPPFNPNPGSLEQFQPTSHPSSLGQPLLDDLLLPAGHTSTAFSATLTGTPVNLSNASSANGYSNVTGATASGDGIDWNPFGDMSDEQFVQLCNSGNVLTTTSYPSNFNGDFTSLLNTLEPFDQQRQLMTNAYAAPEAPVTFTKPMNPETLSGSDPLALEKGLTLENQSHEESSMPPTGLPPADTQEVQTSMIAPEAAKSSQPSEQGASEVETERAARHRKPAASKEVVALTAQQAAIPEWLEAARQYLLEGIEDETWKACTEAWLSFEKENLLLSTAVSTLDC